jgi:hypothetical protein
MSDPVGRLLFPLTSLKLPGVFLAGQTSLDLKISRSPLGKYSSEIFKQKEPVKLSLEKIEQHDLTQALLQAYYFRCPDKEYGSIKMLLARFGLHEKSPLQMQYQDQKYVLNLKVKQHGAPLSLHLAYSPSVARMVARANR